MTELHEENQRRGFHWGATFIVALVAYPLSIGPMNFLYTLTDMQDQPIGIVIRRCYEPLVWIASTTGTMPVLERYIEWWSF